MSLIHSTLTRIGIFFCHRASDPKERNRYVAMVEAVRARGGEVCIFSSMHESGERTYFYCLMDLPHSLIDVFILHANLIISYKITLHRAQSVNWNSRDSNFPARYRSCD